MQRHLLAAITAMGIALVADTTGYGAEPPVAEEDEPSVAVIGSEHPAVAPKDRPDVPIAVDPLESERSQAIAANPKHSNLLVLVISKGSIASGKGRCLAYRSSDGGRTWSQPVPLPQTMSGYSCVEADVAYAPDGSRVYVAYSSLGHILLSSSEDNGATWVGPAFALRSILDYYSYEFPRIATPLSQGASNYVYVTASRHYASPGWNVYFARSTDSGQNWSEPRLFAVGDADNNVAGTVTGGAGGEVLVAWSFTDDYGDDTSGIRVARSKNYEDSFDPPNVAVSAPFLEIGGFPDVKIGGKGAAHLVYRRRKNTDKSDIEYIWSPGPPYTSWSKPVIVWTCPGFVEG
jgi:BNR repeat-like domain